MKNKTLLRMIIESKCSQNKISLNTLSKKIDINYMTLTRKLNGKYPFSVEDINKFCNFFGENIIKLFFPNIKFDKIK